MRKTISLFLLGALISIFLFAGCSSSSQYSELKEEVRSTLQSLLDQGGTSVSYAVMQDGEIVMADAVGYLDGTNQTPVTTDTLYNIGSVSKVYCAAAVMKLVDEGKIDLDDPVAGYLPSFQMQDERYKDITIRMLLNHSSGMPGTHYTAGLAYGGYDADIYGIEYASFEQSSLKADPGTFSVYCNDGFMLAEMLVAEVSGQKYSEFVRDNIFNAVGASSSGYADRNFSEGSYAVEGTRPHEFVNGMGMGGISSNLVDVCRFGQIFLSEKQGVFSENNIKEMSIPQGKTFIREDSLTPYMGLGWDSVNNPFDKYDFGEGVLAKNGGTVQFSSQLYVISKYNMVCAISATIDFSGSAPAVLADIAADVLRTQGIDVSKPEQPAAVASYQPLPQNFKTDYEGIYGSNNSVLRITVNADNSISTAQFDGFGYREKDTKLYYDGSSFVDESGKKLYAFTEADGKKYLVGSNEAQNYRYAMAQKVEAQSYETGMWKNRTGKLYLPANIYPNAVMVFSGSMLYEDAALPGILIAEHDQMFYMLGIQSDNATQMILQIPGTRGRDLYTLRTKTIEGEEWLYDEYTDLRPADKLPMLQPGTVSIDMDGNNALYKLPSGTVTFTIPEGGRVIAYDNPGAPVYDSFTDGATAYDKLPAEGYIRFSGDAGASFTVETG